MKWERVVSKAIRAIGYDRNTETLGVEFIRGAVYHYFNVPSSIHAEFLSASSHGTFHSQHIKKRFLYRRIR